MPRPASGTVLRQMPPEFDSLSVWGIGKLVDRLMADRDRMALKLQSVSDLLRRPAMYDALDHRLAQVREPGKFAQFGTPFRAMPLAITQ
jgi:hypothetical protein